MVFKWKHFQVRKGETNGVDAEFGENQKQKGRWESVSGTTANGHINRTNFQVIIYQYCM